MPLWLTLTYTYLGNPYHQCHHTIPEVLDHLYHRPVLSPVHLVLLVVQLLLGPLFFLWLLVVRRLLLIRKALSVHLDKKIKVTGNVTVAWK